MFKNRFEAGKLLAEKLQDIKNPVIVGAARGGVQTAYALAKELNAPLDVVVVRKLGAPQNPELAIGAVTSSGKSYLDDDLLEELNVRFDYIKNIVDAKKDEAVSKAQMYRKDFPALDLRGKNVVLVDDGIATGATISAAAREIKAKANQLILAVPVIPKDTIKEINSLADKLVYLESPVYFLAVGQFYSDFPQVSDEEVIDLLDEARKFGNKN